MDRIALLICEADQEVTCDLPIDFKIPHFTARIPQAVGNRERDFDGLLPPCGEGSAGPDVLAVCEIHLVVPGLELREALDLEPERQVAVRVALADLDLRRTGQPGGGMHRHRVLSSEAVVPVAREVAAEEGDKRDRRGKRERGARTSLRQ